MEKYKNQDYPTRKLVNIKENLSWEDAKKLQKENKDSWIV
jgi:hypothetical protein